MRKVAFLFVSLFVATLSVSAESGEGKTIKLFNGENLDGWYTYVANRGKNVDPNGVFSVVDGVIRVSGEEWGCITTDKEYENYKITIQYKWGEKTYSPRADKTRDSGLLFHSIGEDGVKSKAWMYSLECNIIEGGTGDFIVVGDGTDRLSMSAPMDQAKKDAGYGNYYKHDGVVTDFESDDLIKWVNKDTNWKDVKGYRGPNDVENPVGEWNTLECILVGDEVFVILNGHFINYATDCTPTKGKIQLQSEGAEIFFKQVEIRQY